MLFEVLVVSETCRVGVLVVAGDCLSVLVDYRVRRVLTVACFLSISAAHCAYLAEPLWLIVLVPADDMD